ncbi:DUF2480 family protein [Cellulophaga sp. HaHaR_3_176]|uniref:DUF2480 family protein n=1 Tax=Cellulophaga sp. HaHaR_3_176 TaxID=1942464 RepID=UPI001C1FED3A|nr:DUF2480 family protein [Cellulophaga sp. HaHaR_3_176]QWX83736.1 DUF2480 family protein [Cellulophaga sp. HaHaR_3_176]
MDEIVNRVSESKLITFDLEDYYPKGNRVVIDVKDWLYEGFILREKEFRSTLESHDWLQYKDAYIALGCSSDAIIPGWAYMLMTTKLQTVAKKVIVGSLEDLETSLYQTIIENLDVTDFKDKPVIIKGCSKKPVPANAYVFATAKIQVVAKSIMYGEACSSVPLYKRK